MAAVAPDAGCHTSIAPSYCCLRLARGLWWVLGSRSTLGWDGWSRCQPAGARFPPPLSSLLYLPSSTCWDLSPRSPPLAGSDTRQQLTVPGARAAACPMDAILARGPALLSSPLLFPPPLLPPLPLPAPLISGCHYPYSTGLLKVDTKAGWGICRQRGAGCCHKQPPRSWTLPALGLGRAGGLLSWVPSPMPELPGAGLGGCWDQTNQGETLQNRDSFCRQGHF